ncbi:MAG: hypothetical protein ACI8ZN_001919 [Bacteroidia bacterium]|jgi:hypothetical protein
MKRKSNKIIVFVVALITVVCLSMTTQHHCKQSNNNGYSKHSCTQTEHPIQHHTDIGDL